MISLRNFKLRFLSAQTELEAHFLIILCWRFQYVFSDSGITWYLSDYNLDEKWLQSAIQDYCSFWLLDFGTSNAPNFETTPRAPQMSFFKNCKKFIKFMTRTTSTVILVVLRALGSYWHQFDPYNPPWGINSNNHLHIIYILSFMHQEGCQSSQKRTGTGNFLWPPLMIIFQ